MADEKRAPDEKKWEQGSGPHAGHEVVGVEVYLPHCPPDVVGIFGGASDAFCWGAFRQLWAEAAEWQLALELPDLEARVAFSEDAEQDETLIVWRCSCGDPVDDVGGPINTKVLNIIALSAATGAIAGALEGVGDVGWLKDRVAAQSKRIELGDAGMCQPPNLVPFGLTPPWLTQVEAASRLCSQMTSRFAQSGPVLVPGRDPGPPRDYEGIVTLVEGTKALCEGPLPDTGLMATHIHEVLRDPPDDPIRLVELISRPSGRSVEFRQFASVFVQLHVPTIGYVPTYDSWAVESLRHHLGRTRAELDVSYVPFARAARYLSLIGLCS